MMWIKLTTPRKRSNVLALTIIIGLLVLACVLVPEYFSKSKEENVVATKSNKAIQIPLGFVKVGQPHTYPLLLENNTDDYITIQGSHASCGCVSFSPSVNSIEPRSHCTASCVITPRNSGIVSQSLMIDTDSDELGSFHFQFHGLAKGIWADTRVVNFGKTNTGQNHSKIIVFVAGFPEAKLDIVSVSEPRFTVTEQVIPKNKIAEMPVDKYGIRKGLLAGTIKGWELDISWVEKEGSTGRLTALLSVKSRSGGVVTIPIYYTVSNMHFVPGSLVFTAVGNEVEEVREALCTWSNSSPNFSLDEIDISTGNQMVKAKFLKKDSSIFLQCSVTSKHPTDGRLVQGHVTGSVRGIQVFKLPYIITFRQCRRAGSRLPSSLDNE